MASLDSEIMGTDYGATSLIRALRVIYRRRISYPFQLIKAPYLFPEQQQSIQVTYSLMRYELEIIQENVRSVLTLAKQRAKLDAFSQMKNIYVRRKHYYCEENLECLISKVETIINWDKQNSYLTVFEKLYENLRSHKLTKINLSKIDMASNEAFSKELDLEYQPFLDRPMPREISALNSYFAYPSETSQPIGSPSEPSHKKKAKSDIKTPKYPRFGEYLQSTERPRRDPIPESASSVEKGQQIYVIRERFKQRMRKKPPTNYIKIALHSQNVKVFEIRTPSIKKQKHRVIEGSINFNQKQLCADCRYCRASRQRQDIMAKISKAHTQRAQANFLSDISVDCPQPEIQSLKYATKRKNTRESQEEYSEISQCSLRRQLDSPLVENFNIRAREDIQKSPFMGPSSNRPSSNQKNGIEGLLVYESQQEKIIRSQEQARRPSQWRVKQNSRREHIFRVGSCARQWI